MGNDNHDDDLASDKPSFAEAHKREQGEAAMVEACKYLDEQGLEYVIYVRTIPGIYARKMRFGTGVAMVNAMWFVQTDMAELSYNLCKVTAKEVDDQYGGL
jgi:hypothetical protein